MTVIAASSAAGVNPAMQSNPQKRKRIFPSSFIASSWFAFPLFVSSTSSASPAVRAELELRLRRMGLISFVNPLAIEAAQRGRLREQPFEVDFAAAIHT